MCFAVSFGGIAGLFAGVSLLSIAEVILYMSLFMVVLVHKGQSHFDRKNAKTTSTLAATSTVLPAVEETKKSKINLNGF